MMESISAKNIPISEVARIMGKDAQYIRQGIIQGFLPIGKAFKMPGSSHYSYYISPKLLYEFTGYLYIEENEKNKKS